MCFKRPRTALWNGGHVYGRSRTHTMEPFAICSCCVVLLGCTTFVPLMPVTTLTPRRSAYTTSVTLELRLVRTVITGDTASGYLTLRSTSLSSSLYMSLASPFHNCQDSSCSCEIKLDLYTRALCIMDFKDFLMGALVSVSKGSTSALLLNNSSTDSIGPSSKSCTNLRLSPVTSITPTCTSSSPTLTVPCNNAGMSATRSCTVCTPLLVCKRRPTSFRISRVLSSRS